MSLITPVEFSIRHMDPVSLVKRSACLPELIRKITAAEDQADDIVSRGELLNDIQRRDGSASPGGIVTDNKDRLLPLIKDRSRLVLGRKHSLRRDRDQFIDFLETSHSQLWVPQVRNVGVPSAGYDLNFGNALLRPSRAIASVPFFARSWRNARSSLPKGAAIAAKGSSGGDKRAGL